MFPFPSFCQRICCQWPYRIIDRNNPYKVAHKESMKRLVYLLLLVLPVLAFTSCEENAGQEDNSEFTADWQNRNTTYFAQQMATAQSAVAAAKAQYGDAWESHCDWRIFRSYAKQAGGSLADSICAQVVESGTGSGYPMYTDSVKVNYIGRLMPTVSYTEGRTFDHSGIYETTDAVFSPDFARPTTLYVGGTVEGFGTALMHMRIGDRWKVYIPQELGYAAVSKTGIPAYSTLVFELQLKAFYRAGEKPSK